MFAIGEQSSRYLGIGHNLLSAAQVIVSCRLVGTINPAFNSADTDAWVLIHLTSFVPSSRATRYGNTFTT